MLSFSIKSFIIKAATIKSPVAVRLSYPIEIELRDKVGLKITNINYDTGTSSCLLGVGNNGIIISSGDFTNGTICYFTVSLPTIFNFTGSLWQSSDNDYKINDVVIGSDKNTYLCISSIGSGAQDPTIDYNKLIWITFTNANFIGRFNQKNVLNIRSSWKN